LPFGKNLRSKKWLVSKILNQPLDFLLFG